MLLDLEMLKQPPFYHEMILVEGGRFMMGSEEGKFIYWETPEHQVTVNAFQIAKYPVTQALWKAVIGENPSCFKGDSRPVERVSWDDTQIFIQKIKEKTGMEYRLPTEAEWEFAARGGKESKNYQYAGSNKLKEVGWYNENSHKETKPVGLKYPNELGLYDMNGNVWEWCQDWYGSTYYKECQKKGVVSDPQGPKNGSIRVPRGGAWYDTALRCRPSCRYGWNPDSQNVWYPDDRDNNLGFRLAASAPPPVR